MGMLADMLVAQVESVGTLVVQLEPVDMLVVLLAVVVDTDELLVADRHVLVVDGKVDRAEGSRVLGTRSV